MSIILCAVLTGLINRAQVADTTCGEEDLSAKVCEIEDAPASFKSSVWKYFVFPHVKEWGSRKGDGQTKNNVQTPPGYN